MKSLSIAERVTLGRDLEKVMSVAQKNINKESQSLRDRIDIQEAVAQENGYNRKMKKLRQMVKECPTTTS